MGDCSCNNFRMVKGKPLVFQQFIMGILPQGIFQCHGAQQSGKDTAAVQSILLLATGFRSLLPGASSCAIPAILLFGTGFRSLLPGIGCCALLLPGASFRAC